MLLRRLSSSSSTLVVPVLVLVISLLLLMLGPPHPSNASNASSSSSSSSNFLFCEAAALLTPTTNNKSYRRNRKQTSSLRLNNNNSQKTFNYFAYGSNMLSSTMKDLRKLNPIASTAAILPGYRLRFNVPGIPGIEPSWASVEAVPSSSGISTASDVFMKREGNDQSLQQSSMELVHGVMHTLTAQDFATVCQTEGVPFSYVLQKCRVIPYIGDGQVAGQCKLEKVLSTTSITEMNNAKWGISAYTLLAGPMALRSRGEDIPPSRSYMNVLLRGAKEFALDESYLRKLEEIPVGKTWIGDGLAEGMLRRAAMER